MNILGISGSLRKASYNKLLLAQAGAVLAELGHAIVTHPLDDLPLYNQDVEDVGMPAPVAALREKIQWADVVVIATPEYNHSTSGVLKNAIDWASRAPNTWDGKVIAMMGAAAGTCGTGIAQAHLRGILSVLGCRIVGSPTVYVRNAHEAFEADGSLVNELARKSLAQLLRRTVEFAALLKT